MKTFTDEALINKTLSGSKSAYGQLMKRYERLVFHVAVSYTCAADDAFDISQDVFVKVFRNLDSYTGAGSFKAWLMRIAHNECISWLRKQKRYRDYETLSHGDLPTIQADQESRVIAREQRRWLQDEILLLNPTQQTAVTLRYFEGKQVREIADVLECSIGNVKSILFRSLTKMRKRSSAKRKEEP